MSGEQRAPFARARRRGATRLGLLLAVFAAVAACGQRGPLTLPDSARPIERLERPAPSAENAPADEPGAATRTGPPGAQEPEPRDEEREDGEADRP